MQTPHQILKQYWGFDTFRSLQLEIINSILQEKDTLALLPTGGGKSICFQVPAIAKKGLCLVISPLIALMKDQVENLKQKGINALAIYSGMSFLEVKKTLQNATYGNYKFLYVSPERLETNLFLEYLPAMHINLIAVDEAHCVSQWGYDFRPQYLRIANIKDYLPNVPILALTASATKIVQDDICQKLLFSKTQQRFQQSFERANLSYSVFNPSAKQNKLIQILQNVQGTAIVYCKSRKRTKEIADLLNLNKINADFYHAGLNYEERNKKQENWIQNKTRVIVCTNAFGMGIDKPDVRVVVHYDVPDCIENYYQEAGRAGRDGKKSYAVLLFNNKELEDIKEQTNIRYPNKEEIKNIYTALMNHLQIAAGSGQGMQYDFDIAKFSTAFKLNIVTVSYAIKILEQEELISFTEMFFKPTTVLLCVNKNDLADFETTHPHLEPTIKGLLRSYEGIFDFAATVYENQLAKFIKKDVALLKKDLKQLHHNGIIVYQPQKEKPQILLLKNRMYSDNYLLNINNYLKRKKYFEQRVAAIINYVTENITCRSTLIATYFNAVLNKKCGICDNCINEKELTLTKQEFEKIAASILQFTQNNTLSVNDMLQNLSSLKKEKIWKVINFLQAEDKIAIEKNGNILSTKKH